MSKINWSEKEEALKYHREYNKTWYQKNREKRAKQISEYGKAHKKENVIRTQRYVAKNKEKVYEYSRMYGKTFAGEFRVYKSVAKRKNNCFELSLDEFTSIVLLPCVYCGENEIRRGIDRVDNKKGYTKENSASCCKICNYMKKTMTVNEFIDHVKKIAGYN